MALNTELSNAIANAMCAAWSTLCNGGTINLFDGVQPTDANTAITTQHLLATLTFGNPAFGTPVAGVAASNSITSGSGLYAGTATWARIIESGGSAVVCDMSVGTTSSYNIVMNSAIVTVGETISATSVTFTVSLAGS